MYKSLHHKAMKVEKAAWQKPRSSELEESLVQRLEQQCLELAVIPHYYFVLVVTETQFGPKLDSGT